MKIVVASTAKQKLQAVEQAFKSQLSNLQISVEGIKAASYINEQPVGKQEIELGAGNRLSEALKQAQADVFVSIENGIQQEKEQWLDYACIILYIPKYRKEFTGFTLKVPFPVECVEEAQIRGFDKHTVGSIIAEMRPDIDKQDPHLSLTGKSRVIFLQETIESLIQQANKQTLFSRMK